MPVKEDRPDQAERTGGKSEDRHLSISPDQLGPGWRAVVPENVKLTEDLRPIYREVKSFSLEEFDERRAQLLVILFEFTEPSEAQKVFQEVGEGLESDLPKRPDIGEGSVIYELDMRPMVVMKIFSSYSGKWLTIFNLWLFKDLDLDDGWVTRVMRSQLKRFPI